MKKSNILYASGFEGFGMGGGGGGGSDGGHSPSSASSASSGNQFGNNNDGGGSINVIAIMGVVVIGLVAFGFLISAAVHKHMKG